MTWSLAEIAVSRGRWGTDAGADVLATIIGAAVIVAVFAPLTVRAYMRRA